MSQKTSQRSQRVYFRKEAFKFSAAHMTVFPDGSKESLHGHNYTTEISFDLRENSQGSSQSSLVPFSFFKDAIREICKNWDEKFLLPKTCPFLKILSQTQQEIEFHLCQKRYVFPTEDVLILEIANISAEALAQEFSRQLLTRLDPIVVEREILGMTVRIDESPGQGASTHWQPNTPIKSSQE